MRIALFLRADARKHPGGQGEKALRYAEYLRAAGVEATPWYSDRPPPGRFDIGHLFNLDWPVETARQYAAAARCCDRIVMSTIHHRQAWMEDLHRNARGGFAALVARGVTLERFEATRGVALASRRPSQLSEAVRQFTRGVRRRQRELLVETDLCLTLARGEAQSLEQDFGFAGPTAHVGNAASTGDGPVPAGLPDEFLLSVGRIEARKNQLVLADMAEQLDLPLVLVGPFNSRHKAISAELSRRVSASNKLIWFQHLDREQVLGLQSRAACHVLASWCEVVPQVDLEAAAAGTRVVTTTRGYSEEYLGRHATYWDPSSGADLLKGAIENALNLPAPDLATTGMGWSDTIRALIAAYERAAA